MLRIKMNCVHSYRCLNLKQWFDFEYYNTIINKIF